MNLFEKIKEMFSPKKENIIKFRYSDLKFLSDKSFRYETVADNKHFIILENDWMIHFFDEQNIFSLGIEVHLDNHQIQKIRNGDIFSIDGEEFEGVELETDEDGNKTWTYNSVVYESKSLQYNTLDRRAFIIYHFNKSIIEYIQ